MHQHLILVHKVEIPNTCAHRFGKILTAKKFAASDPNLVITAFGNAGQKLTAACKDSKNGIWEGTFRVP